MSVPFHWRGSAAGITSELVWDHSLMGLPKKKKERTKESTRESHITLFTYCVFNEELKVMVKEIEGVVC